MTRKIALRRSPIHGNGVFAVADIPAGTRLAEYKGKRLTHAQADKRYADREEVPEARQLEGQAHLMQKKFTEAVASWTECLAKHPTHQSWSAVQQAIVDAQDAMAADKRQAKQSDEARQLWTEFLTK